MNTAIAIQDALVNFRDFGGWPTETGKRVRRDRLYRCGQFGDVPAAAFTWLIALDFQVIVDLRDVVERTRVRSPWPPDYTGRVLHHDNKVGAAPPHLALLGNERLTPQGVAGYYGALYTELPFDPDYRSVFARAIRQLAATPGRGLVHCAVGKDRTGILCALLLSALQVPQEAIMTDFLRSSKAPSLVAMKNTVVAWARKEYGREVSEETVQALLDVEPTYLQAALSRIEREYGSVAGYLAAGGVSHEVLERLRQNFLE